MISNIDWGYIKKKIHNRNIVIWGTGYYSELWYQRLAKLGYSIFSFTDNDSKRWDNEIVDGIICISPENLKRMGDNCICLIAVMGTNQIVIEKQVRQMSIDYICLNDSITNSSEYICDYFGINVKQYKNDVVETNNNQNDNTDRIAVYTAIFGEYDSIIQPHIIDDHCDYYCISDKEPKSLGVYTWISTEDILPNEIKESVLKNRFCKFNPHLFFPKYRYSIYIDGNVVIKTKLSHLVNKVGKAGIAFFNHPDCPDLYVEAFRFSDQYVDEDMPLRIQKQIEDYAGKGFPFGYGFVENSIIVREHNNPLCVDVMKKCWDEYEKYRTRDQICFMYSMWESGLRKSDLSILGTNWRESTEFEHVQHSIQKPRMHRSFNENKVINK